MSYNKKIIVCGDTHAGWNTLNTLINTKSPELLLQCGDFGYWPSFHGGVERKMDAYGRPASDLDGMPLFTKPFDAYGVKNPKTIIRFAPGNHEQWNDLLYREEVTKNFEVMPQVFFQTFGSIITLPDGRTVMFCGGARSIDKDQRIPGIDWFEQEEITYREMSRLESINQKIDIIISHTCPEIFLEQLKSKGIITRHNECRDSSRNALMWVLEKFRPSLWFFGHFHMNHIDTWMETRWQAMNMSFNKDGWWTYLPN
jgi:hypothetical protein